jgi:hypothetical protein
MATQPVIAHANSYNRKPVTRAVAGAKTTRAIELSPVQMPLQQVQERIIEMADELALANDPRETSAVIAKRMGLSERVVDRCLDLDRIRHKRGYHTLRNGVHDALVMSGSNMRACRSEVA